MTTPAKAQDAPAAALSRLPAHAARIAAVEVLLAEPETLGDDVLESCLYLLRERLREATGPAPQAASTAGSVRQLPRREAPHQTIVGLCSRAADGDTPGGRTPTFRRPGFP